MSERPVRYAVTLLLLTAAYVAAARVGLALDAVSGFAALVWPASGIALAAVLLSGYRMWPAIAAGAFLANFMNGAPVLTAAGIALGNTAEALVGAYLVRRVEGFDVALRRVRDVLALILLAALLSTPVSATIGVTSLRLSGIVSDAGFFVTWRAWWIGDAIGVLLVAPLILLWADWNPRLSRPSRMTEAALMGAVILGLSWTVFGIGGSDPETSRGLEYIVFPPLVWAALRFSVRGAVTSVFLVMLVAIAQTAGGHGPFVRSELNESLLALQTFMGITGATFLLLGASIAERHRATRELHEAHTTAEAANRAKAGFLAVVSHELRTPLNAIAGYLDILAMEIDGPLTPKQRTVVERIDQSKRHLLALIEDVLGFAQVEAGRLSFNLGPVTVADSFATVEDIVSPEMKRRELKFEVSADPAMGVRADPDRLRQILLNLVTNAMKFTPTGGNISLTAEALEGRVRIVVRDTGIGIPAEHRDRVFDPFFQVDQGGTRRYPGLGLGLSIVRDAVLAMDGDVSIESRQGKGTSVSVILPAARVASGGLAA